MVFLFTIVSRQLRMSHRKGGTRLVRQVLLLAHVRCPWPNAPGMMLCRQRAMVFPSPIDRRFRRAVWNMAPRGDAGR